MESGSELDDGWLVGWLVGWFYLKSYNKQAHLPPYVQLLLLELLVMKENLHYQEVEVVASPAVAQVR